MAISFALFLVFLISAAYAEECNTKAVIKTWQTHSLCARRGNLGVLIGYGYNINLPHANGDFDALGIDPVDIRKGVIMQGPSEIDCDCTQSFCLTPEQSERLFYINVDRAEKQISSMIRSGPKPCCDIQNSLTALAFTFGIDFLGRVPDAYSHINNGQWQKLGSALLTQSWCTVTDHCGPLARRIVNGCNDVTDNLGCSPPTPQACDASGQYCCAANNTCCRYSYSASQSRRNQAYWCCPLSGAACCPSSDSCCPKQYPVCCGNTNSCCFVAYPVCCFPGTSQAYCCAASSPVCLGGQHCGSLDPNTKPVLGKVNKANQHQTEIIH